jgi:hypothetical protein
MRCPNCNGNLNYIIRDNKRLIYCPHENKEFEYGADGKLVERTKVNLPNVQHPPRVRRSK